MNGITRRDFISGIGRCALRPAGGGQRMECEALAICATRPWPAMIGKDIRFDMRKIGPEGALQGVAVHETDRKRAKKLRNVT